MSLTSELRQLQAARHAEINHLHRTYLRTKREMSRQLSPKRWIRKHPIAAIGIAAAAGLFFAPARAARTRGDVSPERPSGGGIKSRLGAIARIIKHMFKQKGSAPFTQARSPSAESAEKSALPALLETLVAGLLGSLNLEKILGSWMRGAVEKLRRRIARHHEGNGRHHAEPVAPQSAPASESGDGSGRFDFQE